VPVYRQDEHRRAAYSDFERLSGPGGLAEDRQVLHGDELGAGPAFLADEVENQVDVVVFDAGENGGATATEEAAAAGDLGGRQRLADELCDEAVGVRRAGDDEQELQLLFVRVTLQKAAKVSALLVDGVGYSIARRQSQEEAKDEPHRRLLRCSNSRRS
jgi:hypothetical protein